MMDDATQTGSVRDWTPSRLLCGFNCVDRTTVLDGRSSWNLRPQPSQAVKRQLDLNIVLSNYIKHRLEKDDK